MNQYLRRVAAAAVIGLKGLMVVSGCSSTPTPASRSAIARKVPEQNSEPISLKAELPFANCEEQLIQKPGEIIACEWRGQRLHLQRDGKIQATLASLLDKEPSDIDGNLEKAEFTFNEEPNFVVLHHQGGGDVPVGFSCSSLKTEAMCKKGKLFVASLDEDHLPNEVFSLGCALTENDSLKEGALAPISENGLELRCVPPKDLLLMTRGLLDSEEQASQVRILR